MLCCVLFFFFQAEDGIRDRDVTGVQTCVFRSGSLDLRGLSGGNSAVGVGDETASVGIGVASMGIGVASSVVSVVVTVVEAVVETGISVRSISALGSKVGSLGSLDLRGLGGGNGTVGVGHQLSRGSSHASEKNQKLHVCKVVE